MLAQVPDGSPTEHFVIVDCAGDQCIGVYSQPDPGASRPSSIGIVVIVGGPQYRIGSHRQFVTLARDLARAGIPVLRFDYRGMGDSDGDFRTFESIDRDIDAAVT